MGIHIRERKLDNGRISLYLDIYYKGERTYETIGVAFKATDKARAKEMYRLAELVKNQKENAIITERYGLDNPDGGKMLLVKYFSSRSDQYKDNATFGVLLNRLKRNYPTIKLSEITPSWLTRFKDEDLLKSLSNNTAWTYLIIFKAVLNQAIKEKLLVNNPFDSVEQFPKHQKGKTTYLTEEELKSLWNAPCPKPELRLAFFLGCYTGLRKSDINNLKWENIIDGKIEIIQIKTKKPVSIPLSKDALDLLSTLPKTGKNVISIPDWISNTKTAPWFHEAGIMREGLTFHSSRHTFGVRMMKTTGDIFLVSKLMGHADIRETMVYAEIVDSSKIIAINNTPSIHS